MSCTGMRIVLLCSFVLMFTAFSAYCEDSAQEQLNRYLSELQKNPNDTALREKIISHVQAMKPAPAVPEDTKRSMVRGKMAFEGAKTEADFKEAAAELQKATDTAPWFAAGYYNLGLAQERSGDLPGALKSFRLYLAAAPSADDAEAVRTRIYGLEYKLEQKQKGDDRDRELKEILSQVKALGTFADYLNRNITLDFLGRTVKQEAYEKATLFSLPDMDSVEVRNIPGWTAYGLVELRARNFSKAVTVSGKGIAEYKDTATLLSNSTGSALTMKKLLERAMELCGPARGEEHVPPKGKP